MKTKNAIGTAVAVIALCLSVPSCSLSLAGEGTATASVSLGGVSLPYPSASPASGSGSRLITPNAAIIRVTASGEGVDKTVETSALSASVTIADLPVGVALTFTAETLDSAARIVTRGSVGATLVEGPNTIAVTLAPQAAAIGSVTVDAANAAAFASTELAAEKAEFLRISFDAALTGEQHILFDTGKARWAWMGVYDDEWKPVTPVASDPTQGWVVLDVDANRTVNLALVNAVSSPGYPAGALAGTLSARRAVFFAPGASGAGTSAAPADYTAYTFLGKTGFSFFLRGGSYLRGADVSMGVVDLRFYGGFSLSGWNARTLASSIGNQSGAVYTLYMDGGVSGTLDGLTVTARDMDSSTYSTEYALHLYSSNVKPFIINDCEIKGNGSAASASVLMKSNGAVLSNGTVEIASSAFHGGNASSTYDGATSVGLEIASGSAYIHNSVLSGGKAMNNGTGAPASARALVVSASATKVMVAGCEIWGGEASGMAYLTTKAVSSGIAATTIANSRISGGRATGGASFTSTTYGLEFTAPSPSFEVYGNTIDGGFASMTSGSAEYCSGAFINATNAGGSISGNIFFISEFEATNEAYKIGVYRSSASAMLSRYDNNATLYGNVWRSSTGYSNDATWLASTVLDNAFDKARTPGSEFASYGEGAELFADFMAQDWRPKAGALYVGKPGRPNPFTAAQLESYPALGLDLAGKARSASGPWARGAYEP